MVKQSVLEKVPQMQSVRGLEKQKVLVLVHVLVQVLVHVLVQVRVRVRVRVRELVLVQACLCCQK
jgi:hypothetical protein